MRKPQGCAEIVQPDAPTKRADTITCCHCQAIVFVKARQDPSEAGGFCRLCYAHICGPCADAGKCTPFEARLEQMEGRRAFYRGVGLED